MRVDDVADTLSIWELKDMKENKKYKGTRNFLKNLGFIFEGHIIINWKDMKDNYYSTNEMAEAFSKLPGVLGRIHLRLWFENKPKSWTDKGREITVREYSNKYIDDLYLDYHDGFWWLTQ